MGIKIRRYGEWITNSVESAEFNDNTVFKTENICSNNWCDSEVLGAQNTRSNNRSDIFDAANEQYISVDLAEQIKRLVSFIQNAKALKGSKQTDSYEAVRKRNRSRDGSNTGLASKVKKMISSTATATVTYGTKQSFTTHHKMDPRTSQYIHQSNIDNISYVEVSNIDNISYVEGFRSGLNFTPEGDQWNPSSRQHHFWRFQQF